MLLGQPLAAAGFEDPAAVRHPVGLVEEVALQKVAVERRVLAEKLAPSLEHGSDNRSTLRLQIDEVHGPPREAGEGFDQILRVVLGEGRRSEDGDIEVAVGPGRILSQRSEQPRGRYGVVRPKVLRQVRDEVGGYGVSGGCRFLVVSLLRFAPFVHRFLVCRD